MSHTNGMTLVVIWCYLINLFIWALQTFPGLQNWRRNCCQCLEWKSCVPCSCRRWTPQCLVGIVSSSCQQGEGRVCVSSCLHSCPKVSLWSLLFRSCPKVSLWSLLFHSCPKVSVWSLLFHRSRLAVVLSPSMELFVHRNACTVISIITIGSDYQYILLLLIGVIIY